MVGSCSTVHISIRIDSRNLLGDSAHYRSVPDWHRNATHQTVCLSTFLAPRQRTGVGHNEQDFQFRQETNHFPRLHKQINITRINACTRITLQYDLRNGYGMDIHRHSYGMDTEWIFIYDVHTNRTLFHFVFLHTIQPLILIALCVMCMCRDTTLSALTTDTIIVKTHPNRIDFSFRLYFTQYIH